jgi:hypothetical protein
MARTLDVLKRILGLKSTPAESAAVDQAPSGVHEVVPELSTPKLPPLVDDAAAGVRRATRGAATRPSRAGRRPSRSALVRSKATLEGRPPAASLTDLASHLRKAPRFDGARPARREDPESVPNDGYRLLDQLREKVGGMLLLTATPMQLHDFELYSMIELVEPGLFNGYGDFAASRGEIAGINRAVGALRAAHPKTSEIDECLGLLRRYDSPVELLEAASGPRAHREVAAVWLSRCHRLSQALVRNRKVEVGGFTKRRAHRIEVTPTEAEVELERDMRRYIRERYAAASRGKQSAVGLVLVTFQKMLCSSSRALAGARWNRVRLAYLARSTRKRRSVTTPIWERRCANCLSFPLTMPAPRLTR